MPVGHLHFARGIVEREELHFECARKAEDYIIATHHFAVARDAHGTCETVLTDRCGRVFFAVRTKHTSTHNNMTNICKNINSDALYLGLALKYR